MEPSCGISGSKCKPDSSKYHFGALEMSETSPLVSIVIPVYNGSNYLREAIDSALAQTYPNCEVLVINDGSQDGGKTEGIARSYGSLIRYYSKENGGVSSALNYGIRKMDGEWFVWLSHDDYLSNDFVEESINTVIENPGAKITHCNVVVMDVHKRLLKSTRYVHKKITNSYEVIQHRGLNMCSMMIHNTCFNNTGFFNEQNKTTQDVEMCLRLSIYYDIYFNKTGILFRRDHSERGTYTMVKQHKKDMAQLCDFMYKDMSIDNFFPEYSEKKSECSKYWFDMGSLFLGFNAKDYAKDCYKKTIIYEKSFFKKIFFHIKIIMVVFINNQKVIANSLKNFVLIQIKLR